MNRLKLFGTIVFTGLIIAVAGTFGSCKKLALQKDYNRTPDTLDAHLNVSAWHYLMNRSIGGSPDTIFKRMYDGIIYSGIDTNEYIQTNRTFIFLHNDAIYRVSGSTVQPDCFFGRNLVGGKPATSWTQYSKDFVKAYFQYLLIQGQYSHFTLPTANQGVSTLAPQNTYTGNPSSVMNLRVYNGSYSNTQDEPIVINDSVNVRTSDMLPTNGVIQVVDRYIRTSIQ